MATIKYFVASVLIVANLGLIWVFYTAITLHKFDDPKIDDVTYETMLKWKCAGHFDDRGYILKSFEGECDGKALRYMDERR